MACHPGSPTARGSEAGRSHCGGASSSSGPSGRQQRRSVEDEDHVLAFALSTEEDAMAGAHRHPFAIPARRSLIAEVSVASPASSPATPARLASGERAAAERAAPREEGQAPLVPPRQHVQVMNLGAFHRGEARFASARHERVSRNLARRLARLDIDRLSYEELLALFPGNGRPRPIPTPEELARLPTWKAGPREVGPADASNSQDEDGIGHTCAICLERYQLGEELKTLPCLHVYHSACIDRWLQSEIPGAVACPVCHHEVF